MATSIFHGNPGSFKSASALWFEVLPQLRAGRLVVTNIEGILTKESIEIELNETFPETADIWRLSSQTEKGLYLWRRWFWWMPVNAFIIMDEVQDVFPDDAKVFKPEELDSQGIDSLKDKLPTKYFEYYKKEIASYTPPTDEGSTDDTGETVLDENGHIIYPKKMREANMRQRKYNWDLIYCTPAIEEVHKLIRRVCSFAYYHKYNDTLEFIPWFKRKPRIHEHSPKNNGIPKKKDDPTVWRRVPVDVHKLYKSTSTGEVTKRGGVNGFKDPSLIFAIAILLLCVGYATWWGFIKDDRKSLGTYHRESLQENGQVSSASTAKNSNFFNSSNRFSRGNENALSLALPYEASKIYMTGYQTVVLNKDRKYKEYIFKLVSGNDEISINSMDLHYFGISVEYINHCTVKLVDGDLTRFVHCSPKIINNKPIVNNELEST